MPIAELPAVALHYVTLDQPDAPGTEGDDIVLVHGLGANLGFWYLRIAPAFASQHRVTMFDLRGHGLSGMPGRGYTAMDMADDLESLFDYAGIERATIIGHSFGGTVAAHFACRHSERVGRLVMVDVRLRSMQPRLRLGGWPYWSRYRDALAEVGIELDADTLEFGSVLFEKMARLRLEQPEKIERLQRIVPSPFSGNAGKRSALRWLRLMDTTSARNDLMRGDDVSVAELRSLHKPALLVYGEFSQALPTGQALAELWSDRANMVVVPRAGHFFPITFPDKLIAPVNSFIGTANAVTAGRIASTN
jgi:pimeloyl-ACP methyl ester carboxylesterase